ncbi:MAG: hypothetical protein K2J15_05170, partial [Muribaculaceae bacterium]|nr:hypothetical protein [Muribaculaceae bacterium]
PSYSLQSPGASIRSAIYDNAISEISFWACRRYSDNGADLKIFALDKEGTPSLITTIEDPDNKGEIIKVSMPAATYGFIFSYNYNVTDLYLYIDDINVTFCDGHIDTPAAEAEIEYDDNTAVIRGLNESKEYVAYVYPVKDTVKGARSNETFFRLEDLSISGIEGVADNADANGFSLDGNTVIPADDTLSYSIYAVDGSAIAVNHKGSFTLPAKGIYLISTPSKTQKVIL